MVFSTCCLVLSGGALAADGSTFSLVSGSNDSISADNVFYDVMPAGYPPTLDPGLSLGGFTAHNSVSQYNVYQYTYSGKKISGVKPTDQVSIKFADNKITHTTVVNSVVGTRLSGSVSLVPYLGYSPASTNSSGWLSGTSPNVSKCSWIATLNYLNGGGSKTFSGTGYTATLDASGFVGLYSVTIEWVIQPYVATLPDFSGDSVYLNFRTVTSLRCTVSGADSQTQDDILSGVNQGNDLQAETNGLLSDVVSNLLSLPGRIVDGIKGLFVPTDAQMEELKSAFNSLLSEKLGFVYQAGALVDGVFDAVFDAVDNPNSDVSFTVPAFPSFVVDGTQVSLWDEPVVVDIGDNEVVLTVQQVASPFVVAVMVWGFVHSMEDAFFAFVGGKSLFDWVRNRKEDTD